MKINRLQGNRKAIIPLVILLVLVFLPMVSASSWCDNNYSSKKTFTITNLNASSTNNFVLPLKFNFDSGVDSQFRYLKICNFDDNTSLSFYVAQVNPSNWSLIYVRIPSLLSGNNNISVYWDNNSVVSDLSSFTNTFFYYDTFSSSNASRWTEQGGKTAFVISGGYASSSTGDQSIYDYSFIAPANTLMVTRTNFSKPANGNYQSHIGIGTGSIWTSDPISEFDNTNAVNGDGTRVFSNYNTAFNNANFTNRFPSGFENDYFVYEIQQRDKNQIAEFWISNSTNRFLQSTIYVNESYWANGYSGSPRGLFASTNNGNGLSIDWVAFGNSTYPTPTYVTGVKQTLIIPVVVISSPHGFLYSFLAEIGAGVGGFVQYLAIPLGILLLLIIIISVLVWIFYAFTNKISSAIKK